MACSCHATARGLGALLFDWDIKIRALQIFAAALLLQVRLQSLQFLIK